jgi:protein-S-isoprenylcysteine O-methyltransferase Ste14
MQENGGTLPMKKLIFLNTLNEVLSLLAVAVALFWAAGRMDWWAAWAVIAVWLVCFTATDILMLRYHPNLLAERLKPPAGAKGWDRTIVSLLRLAELARYILAGLDQRYGWTGGFPLAVQVATLAVCVVSYALFVWAWASNDFFSQVVRIQSDRGHSVVAQGPYRYVRHPGYAGMIVFELALALLLASWWALLAGGVCALLLVLRTVLEDRTLQRELTGYADYAQQVRFRLLPGIW